MSRIRKVLVTAACVADLTAVPGAALATPPAGVTAELLATGNAEHGIKVKSRGSTDVSVRVITIQPGGTTGWHTHDGPLIAVVKSGTLTRTLTDCSVEVSHPGDSFVEPDGAPFSQDAADPGCGIS